MINCFKLKPSEMKKPVLNQATLNVALKSIQTLINELHGKRLDLEKTKIELRVFKDDYESTSKKNVEIEEKIQVLEKKLGERDQQIQQLDQNLQTMLRDDQKSFEEVEEAKVKVRFMESEVESLKEECRQKEHSNDINRSELMISAQEKRSLQKKYRQIEELIAKKDEKNVELNKTLALKIEHEGQMESLLARQDQHCHALKSKIGELNDEILRKENTIEEMDLQYTELRNHKLVDTETSTLFLDQENRALKFKVQEYEESYNELRLRCEKREEKLHEKIEYLQDELQRLDGAYEELSQKPVHETVEKSCQSDIYDAQMVKGFSPVDEPLVIDELEISRKEFQESLRGLSKRSKQERQMTECLKSKKMSRTEELLQAKYDINSESARTDRKLNKMVIANDNRKNLLTRLERLQEENKQLLADSKDSYEIRICKGENTKLAEKVRTYEEEIRFLTKKLADGATCREENTKLVERMKNYDQKLKTFNVEATAMEKLNQQNKTLQTDLMESEFKSKSLTKENESLERMVDKLTQDVEYFRTNSMKFGTTSCCMELKVNIAYLEKQVGHLEKTNELLDEKMKASIGAEEKLKVIEQALVDKERDLKDTRRELNESKARLQKVEAKYIEKKAEDERRPQQQVAEQPNVNVHVHLDPQQYLSNEKCANEAPLVTREQASSGEASTKTGSKNSEQVIRQLQREIRSLDSQNKKLKTQLLNVVNNRSKIEAGSTVDRNSDEKASIASEELQTLKTLNQDLDERNSDLDERNSELESMNMDLESKLEESNRLITTLKQSENSMKKTIEELKSSSKSLREESKLKDDEHKKTVRDFKKQIQSLSELENDDVISLRRRIQDLTSKKEKHEDIIDKMKEEKSDLKMNIQRLERELEKCKDALLQSYDAVAESKQKAVLKKTKKSKPVQPVVESESESGSEKEEEEALPSPPQPKQKVTKKSAKSTKATGLQWLNDADTTTNTNTKTEEVETKQKSPPKQKGKSKPLWLDNSSDTDEDEPQIPSPQNKKSSKPLWLKSEASANNDGSNTSSSSKKSTPQNKKSSGPIWLSNAAADDNDGSKTYAPSKKSPQNKKSSGPVWLSKAAANDNDGLKTSTSSKKSPQNKESSEPIWLTNNSGSKTSSQNTSTSQNKKLSGPAWLTSSSTSSRRNNQAEAASDASDSEDDFLGIKAASKKRNAVDRKQNKEQTVFGSLDISNRRHVAKRSNTPDANNDGNMKNAVSASEDGFDAIFGRRGPPVRKQQPSEPPAKVKPAPVVRKTSEEQMLDNFFKKPQKKKENDEDLSFLTLDDI
ncbi:putative leucine-rich repeat-containing protein DDB_G0290503 [Clytia hemisphaerica]|uniref:Uncharacterized protein n=1 Tax=Clytia hemisphaerica TaxID=252671 RepID=A0A7M6DMJ0_9CNID